MHAQTIEAIEAEGATARFAMACVVMIVGAGSGGA
jgi:hypothetical protein